MPDLNSKCIQTEYDTEILFIDSTAAVQVLFNLRKRTPHHLNLNQMMQVSFDFIYRDYIFPVI